MRFAFFILFFLFSSLPTMANTLAIDSSTGKPVSPGEVLLSGKKESRFFTDARNMRIELGPSASALFDEDGTFRLLRGSALLNSSVERTFVTVNAKATFTGRVVASYDYREESSSAYVIFGTASLESANTEQSARKLNRQEGATLIAREQYPNLLRNLNFSQADKWLARYGWNKERRAEILNGLPAISNRVSEASVGPGVPREKSQATRDLASYFPSEKEIEGPRKYEMKFSDSAQRGKEHGALEQQIASGEEIEIIAPEEAAVILLPEIDLGPGIRLSAQREGAEMRSRRPASLTKVKEFTPRPSTVKKANPIEPAKATMGEESDAAVRATLERLQAVDSPEALNPGEGLDTKRWEDLRQNF